MLNFTQLTTYQPAADLLKDRVIMVTGVGDGIGKTAALTYAAHGATVILLGHTPKKLITLYDEIVDAGHPEPAIYPFDFIKASDADYAKMFTVLNKEFGRLDGILHNAALLMGLTPLEHHTSEDWYRALQVNLSAPFLLTKTVLPLLKNAQDASVIFTSCDVAKNGRAYWGAYGIAKAGVECFAQILADELEINTRIRVNCINPGIINTPTRRRIFPGENASNLPTPLSLMPLYLYLMGPDSQEITGKIVTKSTELA